MPPRTAPGTGRGSRGGGNQRRGGRGPRGGAPGRGRGAGSSATVGGTPGLPSIGAHLSMVGVKRPGYGRAGRPIALVTNSFIAEIPDIIIHQYDAITPFTLPPKLNMVIIDQLQNNVAPEIFDPRAVYDGRRIMYASHELSLGPTNSREFHVPLASNENQSGAQHSPKIHKVRVTKTSRINPQILRQFVNARQSEDNAVIATLTALNVVIRTDPTRNYPFNFSSKSFLTSNETRDIGGGVVLWRGYFQSVRPFIGRLLINIDTSTGIMYKPGPLIDLCLDFLDQPNANPNILAGNSISNQDRRRLQNFLTGMRITLIPTTGNASPSLRVIKCLSTHGADQIFFNMSGHGEMSVAQYFQHHANTTLQFPQLLCVGTGALLPLERCTVPPGQIMRRHIPANRIAQLLGFSRMTPNERFQRIEAGRDVFAYGQSENLRNFRLNVKTAEGLLPVNARVLEAPWLKYGANGIQPIVKPREGTWNMIDKKLFKPMVIKTWAVVIYEEKRYFPQAVAEDAIRWLISTSRSVGMNILEENPVITYQSGQGRIYEQLLAAGRQCCEKNGISPSLIVVVLPGDAGNDIYTAVKNFGDIKMGVATQCLRSNKCRNAKPYYWTNVCLKINVKLGGINSIPDPHATGLLIDPHHPTVVIGASVQHTVPGASFASVVGSVDASCAKYVATTKVQEGGVELVTDLKDMCKHILNLHIGYRKGVENGGPPARLIFYRTGLSEGKFSQALDTAACKELKLNVKITMVVVCRGHHIRFKCQNDRDAARSGNCPSGTVVDRDIGHPTRFDFYLQSHGGLNGTSRPMHYSILHDENKFDADSMQSLTFMLCHVYARATRSVSVPAPLYYADVVCARAKNHYDPDRWLYCDLSEATTQTNEGARGNLESFVRNFSPLHKNQEKFMYFL